MGCSRKNIKDNIKKLSRQLEGYSRKNIKISRKNITMASNSCDEYDGLYGNDVQTTMIYRGCSLETKLIEWICCNPLMLLYKNKKQDDFTSLLCMWSLDLRHQRQLVEGWSCFDYEFGILGREISKSS